MNCGQIYPIGDPRSPDFLQSAAPTRLGLWSRCAGQLSIIRRGTNSEMPKIAAASERDVIASLVGKIAKKEHDDR